MKFNVQDAFFLLMIFWIFVTTAANDTNSLTTKILVDYVKWFLLYRLTAATLATDDGIIKATRPMIFLVFIIVIESIQHHFDPIGIGWAGQPLGWVDQSVLDAGGVGRTQWINIFDGPGVFCVMFTLILPFILIKFDQVFTAKQRIFAAILLLPLLIAIWFTGSRGGFLATLAIIGAYTMSRLKISFYTMMRAGVLLVIIYAMAPTYLTEIKDENRSAQHRVDMWQEGMEMVEQNPVFGIGKGNFRIYTGRLIAHNSFIEIMGETGAIGVIFWLGLLYLSFKTIYLYMQLEEDPVRLSYARGLSLCLIGYLASSFFVTLEYETLYFILGFTRSMSLNKNIDLGYKLKDFRNIVLILLGLYLMLKIFIRLYY
ncbi:MAG: O-antigen ligase family protein [Gammaproteobacteria bacterium]